MGDGTGEQQRAVEPAADLLGQGEGGEGSRVTAGTGGDGDDAVGTFVDRLVGEAVVDDVVEDDPAVRVHGLVDLLPGTEGGDDDGHLMADDLGEVGLETVVRAVDDEVRGERRGGPVGVGGGPVRVRLRDLVEPVGQLRCRARVERGEGADDAGLALGGDELRPRCDEHRGADDGQSQAQIERLEQVHNASLDERTAPL